MGVCCNCWQEVDKTYSFEGGQLCKFCLEDILQEPETIESYLPEFMEDHKESFIDWICDTSAGDCYHIDDFVKAAKEVAVKEWKEKHPDMYKEAVEEYRAAIPREWQNYWEDKL